MRLAILAGLDSPWSYGAIEAVARAGAEVHAFQMAGKGYIDPRSPAWRERITSLERIIATRTEIRGRGPFRYAQLGKWLRQHFRELKPDAVLSLYSGGLGLAAIQSQAPKKVLYAVGSDILTVKPPRLWLTRRNLLQADLVVANGSYLTERTQALAPRAQVRELLLGIDAKVFVPGHPPPVPTFVCTRGFSPVYNNIVILRALALLPDDLPEWRLKFVAGGPLLENHREWAQQNLSAKTMHRVEFLGGVAPEGVLRVLQDGQFFVSMSKSDGTATSVLEAMSCGLTPILSDIPANRPWANTLVEVDDAASLAQVLEDAIRGSIARQQSPAEIRGRVVREADSSTNMKRLLDWISAL